MSGVRLVDVHCHLGDKLFVSDIDDVLRKAKTHGVAAIISSSVTPEESGRSLSISSQHPGYVYVSLGSDPSRLDGTDIERTRRAVAELKRRVVGIGEVGLDYYWVRESAQRLRQAELFKEWIRLADELGLPLTVHSRSAGRECLQILASSEASNVLMHAYDGKVGHAMEASEAGIFFSIPTSIVYSEQKQKLARRVPIENLLLETDSPALTPSRGERNEPANLIYAARAVAGFKRLDLEVVAELTTRHAMEFFHLDPFGTPAAANDC